MQLSGRPLLDNGPDAALFVDREHESQALDNALSRHLNALLSGDPGIGRTSLLRNLMHRTRERSQRAGQGDFAVTYVRAEGVQRPSELLRTVTLAVTGKDPGEANSTDALAALDTFRAEQRRSMHQRWESDGATFDDDQFELVIIVDDISAAVGHGLFGRLRDELWALGYIWVVSCRTTELAGLLHPPADAFFEVMIDIGPLGDDNAIELVKRRRQDVAPGEWATAVNRAAGGNPRRVLSVIREMLTDDGDFTAVVDAIQLRDASVQRLGRSEAMLVAELEALGPASASDDALLSRLGWTRARAAQVLARLETAGLVTGADVKSGPGRPRKIYRLTAPLDYIEWLQRQQHSS